MVAGAIILGGCRPVMARVMTLKQLVELYKLVGPLAGNEYNLLESDDGILPVYT